MNRQLTAEIGFRFRRTKIAEVAKNYLFSARFAQQIKHRKGDGQKLINVDAKAAFIRRK